MCEERGGRGECRDRSEIKNRTEQNIKWGTGHSRGCKCGGYSGTVSGYLCSATMLSHREHAHRLFCIPADEN